MAEDDDKITGGAKAPLGHRRRLTPDLAWTFAVVFALAAALIETLVRGETGNALVVVGLVELLYLMRGVDLPRRLETIKGGGFETTRGPRSPPPGWPIFALRWGRERGRATRGGRSPRGVGVGVGGGRRGSASADDPAVPSPRRYGIKPSLGS
jgi:hypothetical protein